MIASAGPSSTEGSLLKGTSDKPSSGPLPLTLEKRLKILQKWQTQQTLYTEETREFILKSGFSRDQPEKVPSVSRSSTEGSLLKGTSDDPSSGPLPLTIKKRLEILKKWQNQQTLYTEEIREFILKSGFSRDKQKKDYPSCPSDVEDTDSALVQRQDTDSALVQQKDTDSALVQQQDTDSALVQQKGNPLKETSDEPSWALLTFIRLKREPIKKNLSKLITEFRNAVAAADDDDYNDEPCFLHERGPWQLDPEDDSDDVNLIKSKRSADDKASDAVEITKFGTVPADTILRQMLIQARRFPEEYGLRFLYESDFTELENVNRHVFQISHRNKVLGTAFLFNLFPEGKQYLLTAGHVIAGYDEETVLATEGQFCYPASPVGISSIADVGVLRLKWPLLPMSPPRRPISIDLGIETSTHIYVVGHVSGEQTHQIEECLVLPSRDKDDGFIRFKSRLFSEGCFGSPCLVFKDGQYVVKGMLIGREEGTDTSYELIAITFRCVWKRLGLS